MIERAGVRIQKSEENADYCLLNAYTQEEIWV
jgi:hypothetical protein